MRLIRVQHILLAMGAIAALSGTSCNHHSAGTKHTAAANAKVGPEESFQPIIEMFRRRMEETPVGFVVSDASSRSTLTGTNKVSHEVIKPQNPDESYKAIITVTSQSRYWVARTKEDEESDRDKESKDAAAKNEKLSTDAPDEKNGKSFDPAGSVSGDSSRSGPGSIIGERTSIPSSDKDERKYELVYENGKWKLVTQLNPETEQSVQHAFENALATQD